MLFQSSSSSIHVFALLFPQTRLGAEGLKGSKKFRALASSNVQCITDLSTCSPEEADEMDVKSVLRHHAIVAGAPGSYSHCYQEVAVLGQGDFGKVTHVRSLTDGGEYAVKMTTDSRELHDAELKRVVFEAQLMRQLFHERSVPGAALEYHGMWMESMMFKHQQRFRVFIRMELCKQNLASMLKHHRFLEQELVDIIRSVCIPLKSAESGLTPLLYFCPASPSR
ncbi:MAG: hypothetical protein HC767_08670 [Akkermansiaceae bacterium]|nr:hypothetical protein [Akkermansiaceae bacterium]